MVFFWNGPVGRLNYESQELADKDFSQDDRPSGADHELHVAGKVCVCCGEVISALQPARRVGENSWAHDTCHKPAVKPGPGTP